MVISISLHNRNKVGTIVFIALSEIKNSYFPKDYHFPGLYHHEVAFASLYMFLSYIMNSFVSFFTQHSENSYIIACGSSVFIFILYAIPF